METEHGQFEDLTHLISQHICSADFELRTTTRSIEPSVSATSCSQHPTQRRHRHSSHADPPSATMRFEAEHPQQAAREVWSVCIQHIKSTFIYTSFIHPYIHSYIHPYMHPYIHPYMHPYIHPHIHPYTFT